MLPEETISILEGYQIVLEENGDELGGGVTSIACHEKTGKVVAALDNGKCVVAWKRNVCLQTEGRTCSSGKTSNNCCLYGS